MPQSDGGDYLFTPPEDAEPQVYLKELTISSSLRYKRPGPAIQSVSVARLKGRSKELIGFVRVRNFDQKQKVTMRWVYLGGSEPRERHVTRHTVGISPRWRTWSRLNVKRIKGDLGPWRLDVYRRKRGLKRGELIGRRHFEVTP